MKEFNFSKFAGLQPATLLKIELLHRYFSFVFTAVVEQLFCRTPTSGCFRRSYLLGIGCICFLGVNYPFWEAWNTDRYNTFIHLDIQYLHIHFKSYSLFRTPTKKEPIQSASLALNHSYQLNDFSRFWTKLAIIKYRFWETLPSHLVWWLWQN